MAAVPEPHPPDFSFVIPMYNTGERLDALLSEFRRLELPESWELVLVDDGSADGTYLRALDLTENFPAQVTLVELARNYGEHAAVLQAYRHTRGKWVVNLDDDLQNPVPEAVRLLRHLREKNADVVYAYYDKKQHPRWRNALSRIANFFATSLLEKPGDLYLCSFRALHRDLVGRITQHQGPFPYIDGLILSATNRIERLQVTHEERPSGRSGYTWCRLIRLGLSLLFDFSVMPLRLASLLGVVLCFLGALILGEVVIETVLYGTRQMGWASLMGALAVFSGAQLLMLGIIGEYVGRAFLTVSGKPQSYVRRVQNAHPPTQK